MEFSLQNVALGQIDNTIGMPSERLCRSVERMGVIQPILIAQQTDEAGEIRMVVIDGNRRIAAARAAKHPHIPAIVFDSLPANAIAEATLVTNGFRSANYLSEFWALKHLERNRYPRDEISNISGMANSSINLRTSLSGLHRELFVALRYGKISQAQATAAARLQQDEQERLAERFRQQNKLSRRDFQELVPDQKAESDKAEPTLASLTEQLQIAARLANSLGVNKGQFLAMAADEWESITAGAEI